MRIFILLPAMLLAACNVSQDDANGTTTVEFNQDVAENTAAAVANEAGDIAGHIANDVGQAADRVQNEVGDVDVDVDVSRNDGGNADANANAN